MRSAATVVGSAGEFTDIVQIVQTPRIRVPGRPPEGPPRLKSAIFTCETNAAASSEHGVTCRTLGGDRSRASNDEMR